jgi:formate/nitrite transporter FocA (FNT family)
MKATSAGFIIGLGYIAYLCCESKIFGLLLFSLGLASVCVLGLNLCTGQAGKRLHSRFKTDWIELGVMWFFNMCGASLAELLYVLSQCEKVDSNFFARVAAQKMDRSFIAIFFSALLCGMVIQLAVSWWKKQPNILGLFGVIVCVFLFVSLGLDHCVINSLFIGYDGGIILTLISTIGNMIGGYCAYHALEVDMSV